MRGAGRSWSILEELNARAGMVQALLVVGQVALISLMLIPADHRESLNLPLITVLLCGTSMSALRTVDTVRHS